MSAGSAERTLVGREVWQVDTTASVARFSVRNFGVKRVRGTVPLVSGSVVAGDGGEVLSLRGVADAAGVDTGNARRDKDLRGASLLGVDTTPTWTYASTDVRRDGGGWVVSGRLTARRECVVGLRVERVETLEDGGRRVVATGSLDRRDAGVKAPRVLVGREVDVTVEVVLRRADQHPG